MAWKPSPQVAAARDFAKKFNKRQVVILFLDDKEWGYASYGDTKALCADAKEMAEIAAQAMYDHLEATR